MDMHRHTCSGEDTDSTEKPARKRGRRSVPALSGAAADLPGSVSSCAEDTPPVLTAPTQIDSPCTRTYSLDLDSQSSDSPPTVLAKRGRRAAVDVSGLGARVSATTGRKRPPALDFDSESSDSPYLAKITRVRREAVGKRAPALDSESIASERTASASLGPPEAASDVASVSPGTGAMEGTPALTFDSESSGSQPDDARKRHPALATPMDEVPLTSVRPDRVQRRLFSNPDPVPVDELVVLPSRQAPNPLFVANGKKLGHGLFMSGLRSGPVSNIVFDGPDVLHLRFDELQPWQHDYAILDLFKHGWCYAPASRTGMLHKGFYVQHSFDPTHQLTQTHAGPPFLIAMYNMPRGGEITFDYGRSVFERLADRDSHSQNTDASDVTNSQSLTGSQESLVGRGNGGSDTTVQLWRRLEARALRLAGQDHRADLAFGPAESPSSVGRE